MQSWSQHFTETAGQDCIGFNNIAWLTKSFSFLECLIKFDQLLGKISVLVSADFHSKESITFFFRHEVPDI